ncbi:MAG: extracellular solute-binding protein [Bifidobacteriaceae bacterium]|jgi:raffinose/stachyose/melibiose transport system substrate-binding protein|nr:extracellular solute-binding protein [Bifidobacteriaceae bacterium]
MKKLVLGGVAAAMVLSLTACGATNKDSGDGKDVTLTFSTNVVGEQATALEQAIKAFTTETGIKVDFSAPGESYEDLMKTKMAANELPDVFTTHGWSVARYSDYLAPVNDQPFFSKIADQIKPVITAENGDVYVLPIDQDIAGLVYNIDVLESAGVDVDSLTTWAKFGEALAAIKATGVTPLHMGGKDSWPIGQYGDWVGPSYFITDDASNQREALKSGTFDEATWQRVGGMMADWVQAGFFNEDALTADYASDAAAIAEGKSAFGFYGNSFIVDARATNPDAKLGMMPIPAASATDAPSLIAGERIAVGVWKDSPRKDAAFKLLNFLAKDENVQAIASASGNPAGLKGVTSDIGDIQTYIDKYSAVRTFPYFDREYLPSGMWDVMCATGSDILAQKPDAVQQAALTMQQNFKDKF